MDEPNPPARLLWTLFEPVHGVIYFAPECRAAFEAVGLRGFWRGYFAGRAAPLGAVGAGPAYAAFFTFAPPMVARALPDIWDRATPAQALRARATGAGEALRRLLAGVPEDTVAEAAGVLRAAASRAELGGRVLAAANADLPWPDEPVGVLWQAATILREHRGDGHVAALVAAGLDGCGALVWRAARDGVRDLLQPNRGWTDEQWQGALDRLVGYGWVSREGELTPAGKAAHDDLEAGTDRLAGGCWASLDPAELGRAVAVLRPVAVAAAQALPFPNPVGVPRPEPGGSG